MPDHVQPKILLSLGQLCQTSLSIIIDMDMTVERYCTVTPGVYCISFWIVLSPVYLG